MRKKIPLQIIELEPNNYHLIVSGTMLDKEKVCWIVDTGASKTVFDKNLVEYYSVLEGESDEIHTAVINDKPQDTLLAILKPMKIGKLNIENSKVALLDLSHINKLYLKAANIKICGLIGGDFLMKYDAVINYKKQVMILNV